MARRLLSTASLFFVLACASSGGPIFEFAPSDAPLRYDANTYARLAVETPDGNMVSQDTVWSTVAIEIGSPNEGGRSVSTRFRPHP